MSRILCIDYGTKRCGIAATDVLQIAVHPVGTYATQELWTFLEAYLKKEDVNKVVIGHPTHTDGNAVSFMHQIVGLQRKIIRNYPDLSVVLHDESFTSVKAKQVILQLGIPQQKRRDKRLVDKMAAVLILQDYLNHI
ncbi:MAG: Holliday junction resolvase RuvX [Saprospiraceae bacterium]|nr:Holliday junction resolvase RuvX [Saprospiraceae bacterium]